MKIIVLEDVEQHKRTQIMILILLPNFRMLASINYWYILTQCHGQNDARWIRKYPMNTHALISANGALI